MKKTTHIQSRAEDRELQSADGKRHFNLTRASFYFPPDADNYYELHAFDEHGHVLFHSEGQLTNTAVNLAAVLNDAALALHGKSVATLKLEIQNHWKDGKSRAKR